MSITGAAELLRGPDAMVCERHRTRMLKTACIARRRMARKIADAGYRTSPRILELSDYDLSPCLDCPQGKRIEREMMGMTETRKTEGTGKTCTVQGCDEPVKARGFCKRHYDQWYRGAIKTPRQSDQTDQTDQMDQTDQTGRRNLVLDISSYPDLVEILDTAARHYTRTRELQALHYIRWGLERDREHLVD